ncbi:MULTISPECIES: DNA primase [unclassified Achromobacter]|uniref:DNA primase n=1 Tax=unclassified Achromobacter TaxID=2626865 RepID=UPI000B5176C2|nr:MULTISPECIES: DNA primase [unclassified Achromobacter]OWT77242.1 DNA primase [Achromobacter sp. HZ28]OWT78123.1 DNA primase [Achromobacter sp. HZ34]
MIPESFIQDLLARVDVVDVVGRYVQLRKGGANLLGLCPFHNEKSPSFTVSPTKQFYHCFGCGAHGSAITFLIEHTGASFPEAVRTLAGSVGLSVPEEDRRSPQQRAESARRKEEVSRHTQALDVAQTHYLKQLRASAPAIRYLKQRGLTGEIAAQFGLGWSGTDRQGLMQVFPRYDDPVLVESGLVIESEDGRRYDRFRERIMFPIRNARGALIGFGGRIIGKGEPKYLNSPETPVFSKGQELYGLWEARQAIRLEGQVIVVEGYMDVVGLAQLGIGNAVATLGTATTPDHVKKLLRTSDKVVFSFDGDKAGRRAAWRALQACLPALRDDITLRFLFLPDEHDPDSYVREFGAEAFRACMAEAPALSRFLLDELGQRHNLGEAEGRAACLHEAMPLIAAIPPCALRIQIERELARQVQLTPEEMTQIMAQQAAKAQAYGGAPDAGQGQAAARNAGPRAVQRPAADATGGGSGSAADGMRGGDGGPPSEDWAPSFDVPAYVDGDFDGMSQDYEYMPDPGMGSMPEQGAGAGAGKQQGWQQGKQGGGGGYGKGQGKWQGKGKGGWRRENEVGGVIEPRRPVPTLAKRLLQLLLSHPELVDTMGDQQLEVIDHGPHLGMVRDLIVLAQSSGARHLGALLEAADPESDIHLVLRSMSADLLGQEELPHPQAEWEDALHRIEFDSLRAEMTELVKGGLKEAAERERYQELAQRCAILKRA